MKQFLILILTLNIMSSFGQTPLTEFQMSYINQCKAKGYTYCSLTIDGQQVSVSLDNWKPFPESPTVIAKSNHNTMIGLKTEPNRPTYMLSPFILHLIKYLTK